MFVLSLIMLVIVHKSFTSNIKAGKNLIKAGLLHIIIPLGPGACNR